jgi:hypothetical protein
MLEVGINKTIKTYAKQVNEGIQKQEVLHLFFDEMREFYKWTDVEKYRIKKLFLWYKVMKIF